MTTADLEGVDEFRQRARNWLRDNMPRSAGGSPRNHVVRSDEDELADIQRNRDLQRLLFDGGLAGICVPKEYGGQGLTAAHAAVLNEEIVGYEYPTRIQVPTFTPCEAILLEFGTEAQKREHVPAMLKGEEIWMQLLSEPSGGSDVAGVQTTAVRDGDEWVLNGSKIWTTGAWWSDWGLCLARTNWEVPKHRGLTVFLVKLRQPGVEVHRIEMLNGSKDFCQEFFADVRIPDTDRVGEVDDGWTVGIRWMFHEKSFSLSPYTIRPTDTGGAGGAGTIDHLVTTARLAGRLTDPVARDQLGEAHAMALAARMLSERVGRGIASGRLTDSAAALTRVMQGSLSTRLATIEFELAGSAAVAWTHERSKNVGEGFLVRQRNSIGGGTVEISKNVISERVLGMPRELALDRNVAFRDVPRGPAR